MEPPPPPRDDDGAAPAKLAGAAAAPAQHHPLGDVNLAVALALLVAMQVMAHLLKPPSAC